MEATSAASLLGGLDGSNLQIKSSTPLMESSTPLMTAKAITSQAQVSRIRETELRASSEDFTTIDMNVLTIDWGVIMSRTIKDNSFSENMIPSTETRDLLGHLLGPQRQTKSSITTTLKNVPASILLDSVVGSTTTLASSGNSRADMESLRIPPSRTTPGTAVILDPRPTTRDSTFRGAGPPVTITDQCSGIASTRPSNLLAPTDTALPPDRCLTRDQHSSSTGPKSSYSSEESPTYGEDRSHGVASSSQDVFRAAAPASSMTQRTTQGIPGTSSIVPVVMPTASSVQGGLLGAAKTTANGLSISQTSSMRKSSQTTSITTTSDARSVRWPRTTPLPKILPVLLVLLIVIW